MIGSTATADIAVLQALSKRIQRSTEARFRAGCYLSELITLIPHRNRNRRQEAPKVEKTKKR
ncbi:hypothetical protein PHMEG_00033111 [Phytophthora megakarya]|uniref:Uncharacterized protein n=1 Tax=Phytophthora megakarya TaxID=4795 RepID=A0A225UU29_9STRA|nr:hypothetical protein PHMEG_00033111 [Phytophthora megakarya]